MKLDGAARSTQYQSWTGAFSRGPGWTDLGRMDDELNSKRRLRWEQKLLGRARRGDTAAIGELYNAYAQLIFSRILLPRLGNHAAAEDALSETFRLALERLDQFELQSTSVYFWLARIAINKATDMHRARGVSGRALVNLEGQLEALLESPISPSDALDCKHQYVSVRQRLQECLGQMNPRYKKVIELRFFEELPRERCADLMDVKIGTFDVLLLRALKSLRKFWGQALANEKEASSVRTG